MNRVILDIYFGQQIAENAVVHSWVEIFNEASTYIYIGIILFLLIFLLSFLLPKLFKSPKSYFKRYKQVREEMHKIDELYSTKKLSFEEYSFAQFHYAKEYEKIVKYLSQFPQYSSQLQSYKIKEAESREKEYQKRNVDKSVLNDADFLFDLLRPYGKYYTKDEIRQVILDEGFNIDIANLVLEKLERVHINFGSETKMDESKLVSILNSLLAKNAELQQSQENTINLQDLQTKKKLAFEKEKVTIEKYPVEKETQAKPTFSSSLKGLFTRKPKPHTIAEINDVFAEIEKKLKESK